MFILDVSEGKGVSFLKFCFNGGHGSQTLTELRRHAGSELSC